MDGGTPAALAMVTTKPKTAPAPSLRRPYAHDRTALEPPPLPLAEACPPRSPLVTYSCLSSPHGRFGFCLPVEECTPPVLRKGVLAAPSHGPCGGAGKLQAAVLLPAASVPTQVPAAPRTAQRNHSRSTSQAKAPRPRKARTRLGAWHGVKLQPSELGEASTTILRTICNKNRSAQGIKCSRVNRLAMVSTKPNPTAARPYPHYRAAPAPPPFPLAEASQPPSPLVTYSCLSSPHGRFGFCLPVQQSAPPVLRKGVLAAPWHGRPPHAFAEAFSGLGKRAAAAMLPTTQVPPAPRKPRTAQQKAKSRSQAKAPRPRKVAVPRDRLGAWHGVKFKPSELGEASTIMFRNIPNKIRSEDMMKFLDAHCSRVNRAAGAVIAAYDVVYLPMHFRKEVNFGYAMVNFTTTAAANGFYYSLQNCSWNEHYGSKKTIKMYRAKQQGKAKILQHLKKLMLKCKCDNHEFLPVEFSPPRDGVNVPAAPRRILCRSRKQYGSRRDIGIDQATQQLQFFIKPWNGVSMSLQLDIAKMTVGSLIQSTCKKLGIPAVDAYAVLEGKPLDSDQKLSKYPIARDSTVEIRLRSRAGRITKTFDEQFNMPQDEMFHVVQLPASVRRQGVAVPISSVKFLSYKSTCYLHELLKFVTGTHRDGWSFNGAFVSGDIIWEDGRVHIMCAEVLFDETSCRNDYYRLYQILYATFSPYGLPAYFHHLLEYLHTCPAGRFSNTEALIGFVTNHPCLQHYTDRMRQIMVLATMFPRLDPAGRAVFRAALGEYPDWADHVHGVPEMDRVFFHNLIVDAAGIVHNLYTDTPEGGIRYSNNYMKHAELQVWTEAMEAAYCLHFKDFFPEMLQRMARCLYHIEWVTGLICNRLADKRSRERRN